MYGPCIVMYQHKPMYLTGMTLDADNHTRIVWEEGYAKVFATHRDAEEYLTKYNPVDKDMACISSI